MKTQQFIANLDEGRVLAAIADAEQRTSGEIRVYVSHRPREDALTAAQTRFEKLGMAKTRQRNGVLIYFAPVKRQFAIWGDVGVHERCGQEFWQHIVDDMQPLLKGGLFTEAVLTAVRRVGDVLARYFPREPGDINELPDAVARD